MFNKLISNQKLIILLIIIIAAFLRFYQIGNIPPSLTWDEVAWGYNAYSLGIDGKDEFGRSLPHDYIESFGDFKPPMYAYLDILPVKIFGLNEFAVRFPSAFFGVLSVFVTYLLVRRIFYSSRFSEQYALLTSFILAISPWHIMLSRAAFEANVASFFIILGVYLFLAGIQKRNYLLPLAAVSFVLSMYTFNSARIVAPLLVIGLVLGTWKQLWQIKKITFVATLIGILLILPTAQFLTSQQASLRFKEVNIFSNIEIIKRTNQEIANDNNAWWSKAIHNRRVAYSLEFLKHYFDNLSPGFLFINGDGNPKFSVQTLGQMYLWELPFLVLGILFLFRNRKGYWWIIPYWLLIGIIPAAFARETPHALRIENSLPTFQILVAYGLMTTCLYLKEKRISPQLRKAFVSIVVIIGIFFVVSFLHNYYIHYSRLYSSEWQFGYKDAISYINTVDDKYDAVYLTGKLGRPYVYFLFYSQYNPQQFRKDASIQRDAFGFVHIKKVGKYYFGESDTDSPYGELKKKKTLIINVPDLVPKDAKIKKTFYLVNGEKALVAYTEY